MRRAPFCGDRIILPQFLPQSAPAPAPSPSPATKTKEKGKKNKKPQGQQNKWPPCDVWAMTGECAQRELKNCKKAHPWALRGKGKAEDWDEFVSSLATGAVDGSKFNLIERDFDKAPKLMIFQSDKFFTSSLIQFY